MSQTQLPHRFGSSRARSAEFSGREPHPYDREFVEPFQNLIDRLEARAAAGFSFQATCWSSVAGCSSEWSLSLTKE